MDNHPTGALGTPTVAAASRDGELGERPADPGAESAHDTVRSAVAVATPSDRPAPIPGVRHILAGLDLGKQRDPSVLCLTEAIEYYMGLFCIGETPSHIDGRGVYHASEPKLEQRFRTVFKVRYIESMPLETPYFEVAERVADILGNLPGERLGAAPRTLFIDNTGVGQGVVEIIKDAFGKRPEVRGVTLRPVTLTYGRQEYSMSTGSVSKHALISRLLRLMGAEIPDLEIPRDLEMFIPAMDELRNFQERVSAETGNQTYDGKPGTHDDIVIALALSVLIDPARYKVTYSNRIF